MLKQKIALLVSTLLLLSTVILPGLVSAQEKTQTGELTLEGEKDIFYQGYDAGLPTITFVADDANDNANLSTSAFEQDAIADFVQDTIWPEDSFIGVIDLQSTASTWALTAIAPAKLCTVWNALHTDCETGANELTVGTDKMRAETTVNKYDTNLLLTDAASTVYTLTQSLDGATDQYDVMYWIPSTSGYTFPATPQTVFSAPLNNSVATDLTDGTGSTYDSSITGLGATILTKTATQANIIVGTGFSSALKVPANTAAGAYSGYITYTLA